MAEWKCVFCGWTNAGKWTHCAKCGQTRMDAREAQIRAQFGGELDDLLAQIEENQVAEAPKWEYMQLTSEDLEKAGGLNTLGNKGWELVSMSTYSEGGTVMLIGPQIYHIKALYVLKRPLAPYPEPLREKLEKLFAQLPPDIQANFSLGTK